MNKELEKRLKMAFGIVKEIQALEDRLESIMGSIGAVRSDQDGKPKKQANAKKPYKDGSQVRKAIMNIIDSFHVVSAATIRRALGNGGTKLSNQAVAQFLRRMCNDKIIARTENGGYTRSYGTGTTTIGSAVQEVPHGLNPGYGLRTGGV